MPCTCFLPHACFLQLRVELLPPKMAATRGINQVGGACLTSIDEISDIEHISDCNPSSDKDEEQLHTVTVSAIKDLEAVYHCKNIEPSAGQIVTCDICHSTQKPPHPKLTAKLIVHTKGSRLTLKATDQILKEIAQSDTVTPHYILFAPAFSCHYNFNLITAVSRK